MENNQTNGGPQGYPVDAYGNLLPPQWVPADNFGRPIPPQAVPLDAQGRPIPPMWVLMDAYGRVIPTPPVQPVQPQVQPVQPQAQPVQPQAQPVQPQAQPVQPQAQQVQPQAQPVQPQAQPVQPQVQPVQAKVQPEREKKSHGDAEGTLGKIVMAVLASVFLVISLGIFALVVFPNLSDLAKLLVIVAISFIFYGTGYILNKKKPDNKVYFTIFNCGLAMVYASIMIYYGMFEQVAFFPILLVWAVISAFVTKKNDKYHIMLCVSQVANVVASCYVIGKNATMYNLDMILAAAVLLITLAVNFVVNHDEKYHMNWANWIPTVMAAMFTMIAYNEGNHSGIFGFVFFAIIAVMIVAAIVAGYTCYWLEEKWSFGFGIYNGLFVFALGVVLDEVIDGKVWITDVIMFAVMLAVIVATHKRVPGKYAPGKVIMQIVVMLSTAACLMADKPFCTYSIVGLLAIAVLVTGFVQDNRVYKIGAVVISSLFLCQSEIAWEHFTLGVAIAAVALVLLQIKPEQYRATYRIPTNMFVAILPLLDVSDIVRDDLSGSRPAADVAAAVVFILFVSALCLVPAWNRDANTKKAEQPAFVTNLSIAGVAMIIIFAQISDYAFDSVIGAQIVFVALAVLLWAATTVVLFRKSKCGWIAMTVGILWAILIYGVFSIYEVPGNVTSIVGIIYSILCIVIGFMVAYRTDYDYAPLRMFGLILVLFSLLKLLIWDIDYTTMLARAISFFLAGILCLAISLIYSFVEKKFKKEKQEQYEASAEISQGL